MSGTYLSKVVRVLLIVWTILRGKKRIESGCVFCTEGTKEWSQLYSQCCCGVLWSSAASCRPDLWLTLPGFSYTPCNDTAHGMWAPEQQTRHDIHKCYYFHCVSHIFSKGDLPVPPRLLHLFIRVFPVHCECYIIWKDSAHETLLVSATNRISDPISLVYDYSSIIATCSDIPPCTQKSQLYLSRVPRVVT